MRLMLCVFVCRCCCCCRQKEARSRLAITPDAEALAAQLPLAAGQSCSIPLTFAAGVRATHTGEEVFAADVCLEYVSPEAAGPLLQQKGASHGASAAAVAAAAAETVLGRHAVLPVQVHVQPSVQVSQVQFREVYLPTAAAIVQAAQAEAAAAEPGAAAISSSGSGSSSTFERRCVMEVAVSNRGCWPLQVRWPGCVTSTAAPVCCL